MGDDDFKDLDVAVLEPPTTEPPNGRPEKQSGSSALDRVRARREGFQRDRHVDLDIPGYQGDLVARYRRLTYDEVLEITRRIERAQAKSEPRATLHGQVDTLVYACTGILVRGDAGLEPLDADGGPTVYDAKLGRLLNFEPADTGRLAVLGAFPTELDIVNHHVEFSNWMDRASEELDEQTLGE